MTATLAVSVCTSAVFAENSTTAEAETVKAENVYSGSGDIYVSGTIKEGVKAATVMAVRKNSDMSSLAKNDIYYLNELKNTDGNYAFKFNVGEKPLDGVDVYVYNGDGGFVSLKDYSNTMYIVTKVDVKVWEESLKYNAKVSFNNIFGYDLNNCKIITGFYDNNDRLINVWNQDVLLSAANQNSSTEINLNSSDLTNASYVKLFVWNNQTPMTEATTVAKRIGEDEYTEITSDTFYDYDDPEIYYSGRWIKDDTNKLMKSNWQRPYVRVKFTYTEGQKVQFRFKESGNAVIWYVNGKFKEADKVPSDSKSFQARCALGHSWNRDPNREPGDLDYTLIDVTKFLDEGMNEVMFMCDSEGGQAEFSGLKISGVSAEKPMKVYKPNEKPLNMMIIGDSITSAGSGYAVLTPLVLDADFTNISRSAIALREGKSYGYTTGMETQFNYYESVNNGTTPYTSKDNYDIICVNLGTNDHLSSGADSDDANDFITRYKAFINKLRTDYLSAEIVCIRPFNGGDDATEERKKENKNRSDIFAKIAQSDLFTDEHVHYFDTSELDLPYIYNPDSYDVALHPTYIGHQMITDALVKYLMENKLVDYTNLKNVNYDDLQSSAHYGAAYKAK